MNSMLRLRNWLRALLRPSHVEREMTDEIQSHLDRAAERLVARGMLPDDARREALREFGNIGRVQEEARDARGVRWIEEIVQDVRYGARGLLKSPAFGVVTIVSLVLGVGVNATIFTVINGILRAQAVTDPSSFVQIQQTWSYLAYERLRANTQALSSLIVRSDERILLAPDTQDGDARLIAAELVSSNYFTALRATTILGRTLGPSDERARVGVVNYRFWKASLGGDSSVLGRQFRLTNGTTFTVVGIGSRDFSGVRRGGPDVWLPIAMRPDLPAVSQGVAATGWFTARDHAWLTLYGRLAPGQSTEVAAAQVNQVVRQLAAEDSSFAPRATPVPLRVISAVAPRDANQVVVNATLIGATLAVLLVACFNVAGLMLARAADRGREIAVRLCLGASRARLIRQLITESAVVVGVSALLGAVVSTWSLRALALSGKLAFLTDDDPERLAHALRPDWRVFAFSLVLATIGVLCCGLLPALRATRPDLASAVKSDRRSFASHRATARRALTVAQIALSVVLLIAASLLTRSLARAQSFDIGFERDRVLNIPISLRASGIDSIRAQSLSRDLEQRVAALPGVQSVARGDAPLVGGRFRAVLTVAGTEHRGFIAAVTPSYFTTLGISIMRGRAFTANELETRAQVVVISEATARTLWPNDDALGKTLALDSQKKGTLAPETMMPAAVVVGIARDAQMINLGEIPPVYVYAPSARGDVLFVRAVTEPATLVAPIRALWRSIMPIVPFAPITLADRITNNGDLYQVRLFAGFAGALGLLALVLASIGIFGLMAYSVALETRELGIRMALGAGARDVLSLVFRQAGGVAAIGVGVGVVAGFAATRVISAQLFGMSPLDIRAYGSVVGLIALTVGVACFLPARRATRIDPLLALKSE